MCGIAGIWNATAPTGECVERVDLMLGSMAHRGPDGSATASFTGGAAGAVRLAMLDLSSRGQQPLWSPDRRVALVFNGEMYNFCAERERLSARGHVFRTASDTEVVLTLYLEHGLDFVDHLRGMFGLAILDFRDGGPAAAPTLVLARDQFGLKPLYLTGRRAGPLCFASELRSFVRAGLVEPVLSRDGVRQFLGMGYVFGPTTILRDVRLLEPGTLERHTPGGAVEVRRFGQVPAAHPVTESFEDAAARLRHTFAESVACHARADAPVGAFLSGGVDSTAVVGLLRSHIDHLHTFSLRLVDHPSNDEHARAEASARRLGCDHHTVDVHDADAAAHVDGFIASIDQPSTDGLNTWMISREAARDVKAVLSGLGGDEMFAGYRVVRRLQQSAELTPAAAGARRLAHAVAPRLPRGRIADRAAALAAQRDVLSVWAQSHRILPDHQVAPLLGGPVTPIERHLADRLDAWYPAWEGESPLSLSLLLDTYHFMGNQLLRDSDSTAMAHGLELRAPLVDREVLAFTRSCQDGFKRSHATGTGTGDTYGATNAKRVLIAATRDLLPRDIDRRDKRGFEMPIETWLAGPLKAHLEHACDPVTVRARGLLDADEVTALVAHNQPPGGRRHPRLWALLVLEQWCANVIDAAPTHLATIT